MVSIVLTLLGAQRLDCDLDPSAWDQQYGHVYLRAFKRECEMEVWVAPGQSMKYRRIAVLSIAALSGHLGPKRKEGDLQVPEGVYRIEKFNPDSAYHLSMGIDYPNASDKVRSDPVKPGGSIFIHGKAVSAGCLAMGDQTIEKLYKLCSSCWYKDEIAVHIFPTRMTPSSLKPVMPYATNSDTKLWAEMLPIYREFDRNHRMPVITVQPDGSYKVASFGL